MQVLSRPRDEPRRRRQPAQAARSLPPAEGGRARARRGREARRRRRVAGHGGPRRARRAAAARTASRTCATNGSPPPVTMTAGEDHVRAGAQQTAGGAGPTRPSRASSPACSATSRRAAASPFARRREHDRRQPRKPSAGDGLRCGRPRALPVRLRRPKNAGTSRSSTVCGFAAVTTADGCPYGLPAEAMRPRRRRPQLSRGGQAHPRRPSGARRRAVPCRRAADKGDSRAVRGARPEHGEGVVAARGAALPPASPAAGLAPGGGHRAWQVVSGQAEGGDRAGSGLPSAREPGSGLLHRPQHGRARPGRRSRRRRRTKPLARPRPSTSSRSQTSRSGLELPRHRGGRAHAWSCGGRVGGASRPPPARRGARSKRPRRAAVRRCRAAPAGVRSGQPCSSTRAPSPWASAP